MYSQKLLAKKACRYPLVTFFKSLAVTVTLFPLSYN